MKIFFWNGPCFLLAKFPPICNLCWRFEATSMENGAANMLKASCDQSLRNWDCWIENGSSTMTHWGPGTGGTYAYAPGGSWNLKVFAVFVVGSGINDRIRSIFFWLLLVGCWSSCCCCCCCWCCSSVAAVAVAVHVAAVAAAAAVDFALAVVLFLLSSSPSYYKHRHTILWDSVRTRKYQYDKMYQYDKEIQRVSQNVFLK